MTSYVHIYIVIINIKTEMIQCEHLLHHLCIMLYNIYYITVSRCDTPCIVEAHVAALDSIIQHFIMPSLL